MRLIVAMESRFVGDQDGNTWSATMTAGFWERYLAVFDEVVVAARVLSQDTAPVGWHNIGRPGVTFHPIPYYVGPAQFLRQWSNVRRSVAGLVRHDDAVLFRIGSQVAAMIEPGLRRSRHPFAVEVVGDPWDVFAPGVVRHPLRPFLRRHFSRQMRRQCANAIALGYVTERALQRRYPPAPAAFSVHDSSIELPSSEFGGGRGVFATHYSDVELAADIFEDGRRRPTSGPRPPTVVFVGAVDQLYKAPDVLLRSVALVIAAGLELELDLVGGGRQLPTLLALAEELGVTNRVRLHGELPSGEPVRQLLRAADLFVLPSRTEGLPRAMIEAMAAGLPCIGSTVGGIPELLAPEDLVPPDDPQALADAIRAVLSDPDRMAAMSTRNRRKAEEFRADVLESRRVQMYRHLRAATEAFAAEVGA